MGLTYAGRWKFDGIGEAIPVEAAAAFHALVQKIATGQDDEKWVFENFKRVFGSAYPSTNTSFADGDCRNALLDEDKRANAASWVDSFWSGIENAEAKGIPVPDSDHINSILAKYVIPLRIEPPDLVLVRGDVALVEALDESTQSHSQPTYVKGEVIGKGGFGVVYEVTRTTAVSEFTYAMKVLDPSPFNEDKEKAAARFRREIELLKILQHRGIVPIIEAGIGKDEKPYILMPRIRGQKLRDALSGKDLRTVCETFCEILRALDYAHSLQVLHRDLKPTNILIRDSDGQPIIVDFGCGYLLDAETEESLSSKYFGTKPYIPPEVIRNPKLRTTMHDVYACGVTLYEVVAGALPEPEDYDSLKRINKEFADLDPIIKAALAPSRTRILSAAEFRSRIERVIRGLDYIGAP